MQAIIDFLKGIGDAILGVIDFVVSFFGDVVYMVQMLGDIMAMLPTYLEWLPTEIFVPLAAILTLVVLYKIIGREG